MSLRKAIGVIGGLEQRGAIRRYAIAGAVAALNYIQPALTEDLDILVSVDDFEARGSGLILLTPINDALAKAGFTERAGEGYLIEGWPVQFLPVASPLDEESLERAIMTELGGEPPIAARCLRAEHVVATAVKLGRPKDWTRVQAFLQENAVDLGLLKDVLTRHALTAKWKQYCLMVGTEDPLELA